MKFILGTKQEMTQVFTEDGKAHAATVIRAPKATVTQVKTMESDGYDAVQIGSGEQKPRRRKSGSRPKASGKMRGFNKAQTNKPFKFVREFRLGDLPAGKAGEPSEDMKTGSTFDVSVFEAGDAVEVSGISKGKGFQGVVKRHGFKGGPRTHGQKHSEREPGSIGATGPQRVFKGTRMGGRMGGERVNVKNLKVLQVDPKSGTLVVSGAVPGRRGTLLEVRAL